MSDAVEFVISRGALQSVLTRARETREREIVGFFAGDTSGVATEDVELPNLAHSASCFAVDPYAQFLAERRIADRGQSILALYHSHPLGDASFSMIDEVFASGWDCVHVVVGLMPSLDIRAYRIVARRGVVRVPIRIDDTSAS